MIRFRQCGKDSGTVRKGRAAIMGIGCGGGRRLVVDLFCEIGGGPENIIFGEFVSVVGGGGGCGGNTEEAIHCRISEHVRNMARNEEEEKGEKCVGLGLWVGVKWEWGPLDRFPMVTRPTEFFFGNPRG